METSVIVSGFGGQGLLFAGTVLARPRWPRSSRSCGSRPTDPRYAAVPSACTVIISNTPFVCLCMTFTRSVILIYKINVHTVG